MMYGWQIKDWPTRPGSDGLGTCARRAWAKVTGF